MLVQTMKIAVYTMKMFYIHLSRSLGFFFRFFETLMLLRVKSKTIIGIFVFVMLFQLFPPDIFTLLSLYGNYANL